MKLSVTTYSYYQYLKDGRLDLYGVIDKSAELGFDGIEFDEPWGDNELDQKIAIEVKAYCQKRGLEIVAYCISSDFLKNNTTEEVARVKGHIDFAASLGAHNIRFDISHGFGFTGRKYSIGYDDALPILVPAIREIADYAEANGICTITENHGYFSQDALRVEKLINAVAHPNFGALVDLGNFMCADEDAARSVSILAPYAKHVHAKDMYFRSGSEIDPGEGWGKTRAANYLKGTIIGYGAAEIFRSIQILKKVGYDGYVTVEFEGSEDNIDGIRIGKDNLARFIGNLDS